MFKKILVPIDGTTFSETILPYIRSFAMNQQAEVHLVRVQSPGVYEPPWGMVLLSVPESMQVTPADQLEMLAQQLQVEGIQVQTEVADGDAADGILDCARRHDVDLIAMTTHGRTGLDRLVQGSVADKVLHEATMPVLLIHP